MSSIPAPPPLPVSALDYYEAPAAADLSKLVRKLGGACTALGGVWALTHGWTAAGLLPGLRGSGSLATYTRAFQVSSVVFTILAIVLLIGGILCLAARPSGAARTLLLTHAIGTLTVGVLVRLIVQLSYGVERLLAPASLASFGSSIALIVSFPIVLLIVLRVPSIRAVFR